MNKNNKFSKIFQFGLKLLGLAFNAGMLAVSFGALFGILSISTQVFALIGVSAGLFKLAEYKFLKKDKNLNESKSTKNVRKVFEIINALGSIAMFSLSLTSLIGLVAVPIKTFALAGTAVGTVKAIGETTLDKMQQIEEIDAKKKQLQNKLSKEEQFELLPDQSKPVIENNKTSSKANTATNLKDLGMLR